MFNKITFNILTIFPDIFDSYFNKSILKRAQNKKLIQIKIHDLRDYTNDKHKTVDDKPYGGGAGMVMKVEPIVRALSRITNNESRITNKKSKVILLTPRGKQFTQATARRLAKLDNIILICGHYEGVDERVNKLVDEKISIGNYVLTSGELPAMVIIDAVSRLKPGVLGNPQSLTEESFSQKNTIEYPQYTRPEIFTGPRGKKWRVPKVLLSGNHQKIKEWREKHET